MKIVIGDFVGLVALIIALIALYRDMQSNREEREHRKKTEFIDRVEWTFREGRHPLTFKTIKHCERISDTYIVEIEPVKISAELAFCAVKKDVDVLAEHAELDVKYTPTNKSIHVRVKMPKRRFFGFFKKKPK